MAAIRSRYGKLIVDFRYMGITVTSDGIINNTTGKIVANTDSTIRAAGDIDNSENGAIVTSLPKTAEGDIPVTDNNTRILSITSGGTITNQGENAYIASMGDLNVVTETLSNQAVIQSHHNMNVQADTLQNDKIIQSKGFTDIVANQSNNTGQMISTGDMTVTERDINQAGNGFNNTGSVYSREGGIGITTSGSLTNNGMDEENKGSIAALNDVTITAGSLSQNEFGQLVAGLSAEGELIENEASLTVTSPGIQTNAGKNIASGNISMSGSGLDLTGGTTSASGIASFTAKTDGLVTDSGEIEATGYVFDVSSLSNVNKGKITQFGDQDFTLVTTGDINNSDGYIGVRANKLTLTSLGILNNNKGNIVHSNHTAQDGTIIHHVDTATISADQLYNHAGNLLSDGSLTVDVTGSLSNSQGGVIQAQALDISANILSNDSSKIISTDGGLDVFADSLVNQGDSSIIQSADNLTLAGGSINNSDLATIYATKNAYLTVDEIYNDTQAVIASDEILTITENSLVDNNARIASVNNQIIINSQYITNRDEGAIQARSGISIIDSGNVTNSGVISSQDSITAHVTGDINNDAGVLTGTDIDLISGSNISNESGLIGQTDADKKLTINAQGSLNNTNSMPSDTQQLGIIANGQLDVNASHFINNLGLVTAPTIDITLHGQDASNNRQGIIQANDFITLTANNSSALNNQGGLISADSLFLQVGDAQNGGINNNGAGSLIQAGKDLTIITGQLNNARTKVTSVNSTTPSSQNQLSASPIGVGGSGTTTNTYAPMRSNQGLMSGNTIDITTTTLNNSLGQILSNDLINISAIRSIDNNKGLIRSTDVKLTKTAHDALVINNLDGEIGADNLDISAYRYNNNGVINANTASIRTTADFINDENSQISANNLTIGTSGDFKNTALLSATNLNVNADNILNEAEGIIQGGDTAILYARSDINNLGSINSNGLTQLTASNITNQGVINGADTYLNAENTVNNLVNGRIYGDHVAIEANTLNNSPGEVLREEITRDECAVIDNCAIEYGSLQPSPDFLKNAIAKDDTHALSDLKDAYVLSSATYYKVSSPPAPVILARNRLDIGANTVNNDPNGARAGIFNEDFNGQAKIVSLGDMSIGGTLNEDHEAIGNAQSVNNVGATIESRGNMSIATDALNNENADFDYNLFATNGNKGVIEYSTIDGVYSSDEVVFRMGGWRDHWKKTITRLSDGKIYGRSVEDGTQTYNQNTYDERFYETRTVASDPALIRAGGNLSIDLNTGINDNSIIVDGGNLELNGYTTGPNIDTFDNKAITGTSILEKINGSKVLFYTKDEPRSLGRSDRPYTHTSAPSPATLPAELIDTYKLPILNLDIVKAEANLTPVEKARVSLLENAIKNLAILQGQGTTQAQSGNAPSDVDKQQATTDGKEINGEKIDAQVDGQGVGSQSSGQNGAQTVDPQAFIDLLASDELTPQQKQEFLTVLNIYMDTEDVMTTVGITVIAQKDGSITIEGNDQQAVKDYLNKNSHIDLNETSVIDTQVLSDLLNSNELSIEQKQHIISLAGVDAQALADVSGVPRMDQNGRNFGIDGQKQQALQAYITEHSNDGEIDEMVFTNLSAYEISVLTGDNSVLTDAQKQQLLAGNGYHFIVIDSIQEVNGVPYYMVRDPYVISETNKANTYGVRADFLNSKMNELGGLNTISLND